MTYYIKMTDKRDNFVLYKRYKCIEGWTKDKSICWKFSKQGAKGIIKTLMARDANWGRDWREYELEEAE